MDAYHQSHSTNRTGPAQYSDNLFSFLSSEEPAPDTRSARPDRVDRAESSQRRNSVPTNKTSVSSLRQPEVQVRPEPSSVKVDLDDPPRSEQQGSSSSFPVRPASVHRSNTRGMHRYQPYRARRGRGRGAPQAPLPSPHTHPEVNYGPNSPPALTRGSPFEFRRKFTWPETRPIPELKLQDSNSLILAIAAEIAARIQVLPLNTVPHNLLPQHISYPPEPHVASPGPKRGRRGHSSSHHQTSTKRVKRSSLDPEKRHLMWPQHGSLPQGSHRKGRDGDVGDVAAFEAAYSEGEYTSSSQTYYEDDDQNGELNGRDHQLGGEGEGEGGTRRPRKRRLRDLDHKDWCHIDSTTWLNWIGDSDDEEGLEDEWGRNLDVDDTKDDH